jgi:hypothetical protein
MLRWVYEEVAARSNGPKRPRMGRLILDGLPPLRWDVCGNSLDGGAAARRPGCAWVVSVRGGSGKGLRMRLSKLISLMTLLAALTSCGKQTPNDQLGEGVVVCDTAEVKAAIAAKADVNVRDKDSDYTPLMMAAYGGCSDVVRVLTAAGADVNAKTRGTSMLSGQTALNLAASGQGTTETINALIGAGADLGAKNSLGTTALATAARYGKLGSVEALVKAGADVNSRDNFGGTPLSEALFKTDNPNFGTPEQHADVAQYLRQHGGLDRSRSQ